VKDGGQREPISTVLRDRSAQFSPVQDRGIPKWLLIFFIPDQYERTASSRDTPILLAITENGVNPSSYSIISLGLFLLYALCFAWSHFLQYLEKPLGLLLSL